MSDAAVDSIFERTEGNPLFVTEIARGLADELSRPGQERVLLQIPDGIREAIGRRLNHLPDDCNDLLGVASVIGPMLLLDELAALAADKTPIEILQILQPAVASGILEVDEQSARLQFSHILIRDMLFEELPLARRLLLHREFAEALRRLHADYPEPALGKIARHYYLAIQAGCVQEAVKYATQAAHHYRRVLAFEEAVTYYELAIDAQTLDKGDHRRQLAELYLCLARSRHYAGAHVETIRELLEQAMAIAKDCGHYECFVEGACDYVYCTLDKPDERGLTACNAALAMLPPENTVERARVLVQKSVALKIIDRRADAEKLVYEAIDLAQQCGRYDILCEVLSWGNFSLRGRPEMLSERIALGERCLQVAREQRRLAYYAAADALAINMHLYWVGPAADLWRAGDRSLEWLLLEAANGEVFAAGHAEAGGGYDKPALYSNTTAKKVDGGYCFTGHKQFGSLGPVWTRLGGHGTDASDPKNRKIVHAFIPRDADGVKINHTWDVMGMRATQSDDTVLDAVFVPDRYVARVVPEGFGGADAFVLGVFAWACLGFGNVYCGLARAAFDRAITSVKGKEMRTLTRPLAWHAEIQHQVAEMAMTLESIEALLDKTAEDWSNGVDHAHLWPANNASSSWRNSIMALLIIERNFAEAIAVNANDPDILRVSEEVGVRWLYSFLSADKKKTYCLYEAPNPDALHEAARRLNIPADVIIEVDPIRGPDLPAGLTAL